MRTSCSPTRRGRNMGDTLIEEAKQLAAHMASQGQIVAEVKHALEWKIINTREDLLKMTDDELRTRVEQEVPLHWAPASGTKTTTQRKVSDMLSRLKTCQRMLAEKDSNATSSGGKRAAVMETTESRMKPGIRVRARYRRAHRWYYGVVKSANADGSYDVDYDDGDEEESVQPQDIRPLALIDDGWCTTPGCELRAEQFGQRSDAAPPWPEKRCGTPGCNLPDWHAGCCIPLQNLGARQRRAKVRWEPAGRPAGRPAKVPRTTAIAPRDDASTTWVRCDRCSKWRLLVDTSIDEAADWFCEMNPDATANTCEAPEPSACHEVDRGVPRNVAKDLYFVDRIMAERVATRGSGKEYLVRWLGWAPKYDSWEPYHHIEDKSLIYDFHYERAKERAPPSATTNVMSTTWAFVAKCPSIKGRGLFARAPLQAGQAICEYGGPRLPATEGRRGDGQYVLHVPSSRILIDGNGDNLPGSYELPRFAAIFANHSASPNAALEYWPDLHATQTELSGNMWLVATEPIDAGAEIRINYEAGEAGKYWLDGAPDESAWRDERISDVGEPLAQDVPPAIGVLDAIREAAARWGSKGKGLPNAIVDALAHAQSVPTNPLSVHAARERIRQLAPRFARSDNRKTWGLVATHLPAWSGRGCYDLWISMGKQPPLQDQQTQQQAQRQHQQADAAGDRRRPPSSVTSTILRTMH